ncbi:hypothetical protein BGM09_03625 [Streptomyces sp. CBMA29]|nr:hypothetical protein [Streptomyces sp. CBMA29]
MVPDAGPAQAPPRPSAPAGPDAARTQARAQTPAVYEPARRVLRILPFGAGLALVGLGLGFLGLRLRRD